LGWIINGKSITDTTKQERAITSITTNASNGTISSVLTIVALPVNDGIMIRCFVGTNVHNLVHSSAPLTIRGISPVENISLVLDLNSSMLYWSPPSSIPSQYEANHPLLSYIVAIGNGPLAVVYTTDNYASLQSFLTICDIVNTTHTITVHVTSTSTNGNYSSDGVIIIDEYLDCELP
jgi:hypothetical protein